METQLISNLSRRDVIELDRDHHKAARLVRLTYVTDREAGFTRVRRGASFIYVDMRGRKVNDAAHLERIRRLVIPPAWSRVWICARENGHLQATGFDALNRKQYKYHTLWSRARNETKFHKLLEFGKHLPLLRAKLRRDLSHKVLDRDKVIATVVNIMELTYIRIGNEDYQRKYGSRGLTTLCDDNVAVSGPQVRFVFKGKKSISQDITLRNRRLARLVKQCRDIPGKELFQYYDEDGARQPIDSGMVNDYLKEAMQMEFTAKDFRTWAGTLQFMMSLHRLGVPNTAMEVKRNINTALDEVSRRLGNTRSVCRKYYVHPCMINAYEDHKLDRFLKKLPDSESADPRSGLTPEEKVMMGAFRALTF